MQKQKYSMEHPAFWKISLSLAIASFFVFASLYMVQPLAPAFVRAYNITVSEATLALSVSVLGLIVGLFILGFFSDRKGRIHFIKYSLIASVIPFLLIPLFDSFYLLMLLRFIQGFVLAGLPAAALAYINEEIDPVNAGIATALYIASNALGGMAGRFAAGFLSEQHSLDVVFYSFAGLGAGVILIVFSLLPKSRFFEASRLPFRKDVEGMLYHFKNPLILTFFGMGVILQYAFTSVWTYLPFHLGAEPYALSAKAISYTFLTYGFGVVGAPFAGWLSGYFGSTTVRITGILVLSLGILATLSPPLPMIIIGLCLICLGFFTSHSLTASTVTEVATHHKGSASSIYLISYYLGVSLGSSLAGPVWEFGGWKATVILAAILPLVYLTFVANFEKRIVKEKEKSRKQIH